jgi:teichuronic acid biosynthesis glycosyltransferase TuaC
MDVYHPRYLLLPKISMPFHGLLMFAGSLKLVWQLHKSRKFDCIDAHYVYPDGFAAVLLGKCLGIPVFVSARGTDMSLFPSFRLIRPMISWTIRNAAGVVGVCEALKESMLSFGVPAGKALAIGNGVDPGRFEPMDRTDARRKLGMADDAEIILAVGGLVPVKGYQYLIPAFAQIARHRPRARLYIVGEGDSRATLEAQAVAENVGERVFFVGRRPNEDLKYWYSAADVTCLASSREGWANVLLESMACGTPLVATRVWGTPEVIVSDELGVLVEQTSDSIARGLELALRRKWDRQILVRYAATRTWDVVAEEVENFLETHVGPETSPNPEVNHA